jgi:crotonobetainyl-CoA:carnitine CoA-transferase CaiB-like acyl-CoA transferase
VGNRLDASAPRNAYRTGDGRWVALSGASPNIAARVYRTIGRPDLAENADYMDPIKRQARAGEVDELVADWIGRRTLAEAMEVFEQAEVAAAPVYDAAQLVGDEHLVSRGTFLRIDDPDLGPVRVQAPVAVLSDTPASVSHLGAALGADNETIYGGLLGLDADRLVALRSAHVI